jgi:hypothetical protein
MAHVESTVWPISDAAGSGSGGGGSEERNIFVRSIDADLRSDGGDARVENSRSESFYFGPSTITVSRIHGMVDSSYFDDEMGREPREETMPKPHDGCWCFVCSSASTQNCQCCTSSGVFSRYLIYIFPWEEVPLSCLRLTQGITQASTTRLYRSYVKKT